MAAISKTDSPSTPLGQLPRWKLDDLYGGPHDPVLADDIERAGKQAAAFAKAYKGKLARLDGKALAEAVATYESLSDLVGRIGSFAMLHYVGDTTDATRSKFNADIRQKLTDISTHVLFFELELNHIDDDRLEALLKEPGLARYRPWIADLRKEKPYQLTEKIEELFHEKELTGRAAFNRLFDETMASLEFDVDGEKLSLEPTLALLQHEDENRRKCAARAIAATLGDNARLFTLITNTLAKDKEISDRWRGFADVAASRHLANRVEPEVVDALVEAVTAAYPRLSHRYYAMKAKWLGKEKLDHWDRVAPLPGEDTTPIAWEEARDIVLAAYGRFAPQMAEIADEFFAKGWIDAPVAPGKAPGAFSHPTVPSAHPYVLLNYQGKARDVMTLAHELGHGVHQMLARDQGALMAPTPLTLAETASVFGEMLTFQSLLERESDPQKRKILLAGKVEDMLATVVRQISFYCFEREVHTRRRDGELTSDDLNAIWLETSRQSLGPAVRLGEGYEVFWSYIPHFIHAPFYVYAYAFGDCLVNSLYARYREAETGFQEKYFDLLRAGGSKHHSELLAPFGLDASDPQFWSMGLKVIENLIDDIEELDGSR